VLRPAIETVIGRPYSKAGKVDWELADKQDRGDHLEMTGKLFNRTYNEELNVVWLYPKNWKGRVVIWLGDSGKGAVEHENVKELVAGGTAVLGADLLYQGGEPVKQTRVVENPREFAGYTHGYNHALFAQRVHDILTLVTFLRNTKVGSHPARTTSRLPAGAKPVLSSSPLAASPERPSIAPLPTPTASASGKFSIIVTPDFCPAEPSISTFQV
jgi:hypothetical protein